MSGLAATDGPRSARSAAIAQVFEKLVSSSVLHIAAPPFSGKSSLARLIGLHAISTLRWDALYVPCSKMADLDAFILAWCGEPFHKLLARLKPTLLIFDDAHDIYENTGSFWNMVKHHESTSFPHVKLLFLATVDKTSTSRSPFTFTHRLPAAIVMAQDEDVSEMFDDFDYLATLHGQPVLGAYLRFVVARLVGHHIGLLRFTLYHVYKFRTEGDATLDSEVVGLLLHSKFHFLLQGLRVSFDVLRFSSELRGILNAALDGPVTPPVFPMNASEPYSRLVDMGLFVPGDGNTFQYASPLIRRIVFNQLYCSLSRPLEAPPTLIEFVQQSLRLINVRFTSFLRLPFRLILLYLE